MEKIIRQGDVVVVVSGGRKPKGKLAPVPREGGKIVLAHGEITGHSHSVIEEDVDLFVDEDGRLFLAVRKDCVLHHEEHRREQGQHVGGYPVIPRSNDFVEVRRQREYEPGELPKPVVD